MRLAPSCPGAEPVSGLISVARGSHRCLRVNNGAWLRVRPSIMMSHSAPNTESFVGYKTLDDDFRASIKKTYPKIRDEYLR